MTRRAATLALAAAPLLAGTFAEAQDAAWRALALEGSIAIMRHARAPGTGDPPGFVLGACETQRLLDDAGRRQAMAVGRAIRAAGLSIDAVRSSRWCRCLETARLLDLAPVEPLPALDSFYADRSARPARMRALRDHLAGLAPGQREVLVTHQVNITALTGRAVASGEVFVIGPRRDGSVEVRASALIRS